MFKVKIKDKLIISKLRLSLKGKDHFQYISAQTHSHTLGIV